MSVPSQDAESFMSHELGAGFYLVVVRLPLMPLMLDLSLSVESPQVWRYGHPCLMSCCFLLPRLRTFDIYCIYVYTVRIYVYVEVSRF